MCSKNIQTALLYTFMALRSIPAVEWLPLGYACIVQQTAEISYAEKCNLQVVVMAIIIGSLFSGQKPAALNARNYFGVSFLAMMFLSMGAMPEMGITFANKPCAPQHPLLHKPPVLSTLLCTALEFYACTLACAHGTR